MYATEADADAWITNHKSEIESGKWPRKPFRKATTRFTPDALAKAAELPLAVFPEGYSSLFTPRTSAEPFQLTKVVSSSRIGRANGIEWVEDAIKYDLLDVWRGRGCSSGRSAAAALLTLGGRAYPGRRR